MENISNSFVIVGHTDKIRAIAQIISEMGYNANFVDADNTSLRIFVPPDEVCETLKAI